MSDAGDERVDPFAIVEQHWAYDGPHTPERIDAAVTAAAQLVRYLNNATGRHGAYVAPSARLLGGVATLVARLPQLLEQTSRELGRQADNPAHYDDRRDRPASQTIGEVRAHLAEAAAALGALQAALDQASAGAFHLGTD